MTRRGEGRPFVYSPFQQSKMIPQGGGGGGNKNISDNRNFLYLPKGEVLFQHNQSPKLPPRLLRIGEKKSSAYARRRQRKRGAGPLKGQIPGGGLLPSPRSSIMQMLLQPRILPLSLLLLLLPRAEELRATRSENTKYRSPFPSPDSHAQEARRRRDRLSLLPPKTESDEEISLHHWSWSRSQRRERERASLSISAQQPRLQILRITRPPPAACLAEREGRQCA